MSLRRVDLNLLPILQALLREGSVSRAAAVLGLSQPATSQALGRLRDLLKDPLLVKVGRTMVLTPRAKRLRVLADETCTSVAALLSEEGTFDPATAVRSFSIATPDYNALIVAQELLPLLREVAPGISVSFVDANPTAHDQLLDGLLDLAVIARVPAMLNGLSVYDGFLDDQVCIASLEHPLAAQDKVSIEELSRYRRLEIDFAPHLFLDTGGQHLIEPVKIAPSHLLVLPLLAAASSSIAIVTRSLGRLAARYAPLKLIELLEPNKPIDLCIAWSPVNDADAAHRWLRDQLARILEGHLQRVPGTSNAGRTLT